MTSWFPIGPDFVFYPRNPSFARLSRQNEHGSQCNIYDFAIDPKMLTMDNKWQAVGAPILLSNLDALHPQVASWAWTVPPLMAIDSGHYCLAVFVHAANALLDSSLGTDIDQITPLSKQIGQKNLQVISPGAMMMIRFHNPTPLPRRAELVFDTRALPKQLQVGARFSAIGVDPPLTARRRKSPLSKLAPKIHKVPPKTTSIVREIVLPPGHAVAARITVNQKGRLPAGSRWSFDVQQCVDGKLIGGGRVVVRIPGQPKPVKTEPVPEYGEGDWREKFKNRARYLPPWIPGLRSKR